jgi:hypothetical protein
MRASSLSNPEIIEILNRYFVPVHVDGVYVNKNPSIDAEEKAAYRGVFDKFHKANKENEGKDQPKFSVGSVHAYILTADGQPVDSLHVADAAKPARLLEMLKKAKDELKIARGEPLTKLTTQSAPPKIDADAILLHLTSRYLVRKGDSRARKDLDDDLLPLLATGLGKGQGGWHSLPSEDWIILTRADSMKLLPSEKVAVGKSWDLDSKTAAKILIRCYPTTELNDLAENRIDQQSLKATVISADSSLVRARLEGKLKMKHAFYPRRDDNNFVEATFVGIIEFDVTPERLRSLRLVTEHATYGGNPNGSHPFGVAVHSLP